MTRGTQHARNAAASDGPHAILAAAPRSPAPEWPSARCLAIGYGLAALFWSALAAWWFS